MSADTVHTFSTGLSTKQCKWYRNRPNNFCRLLEHTCISGLSSAIAIITSRLTTVSPTVSPTELYKHRKVIRCCCNFRTFVSQHLDDSGNCQVHILEKLLHRSQRSRLTWRCSSHGYRFSCCCGWLSRASSLFWWWWFAGSLRRRDALIVNSQLF